jgi:hypothetical protein
MTDHCRWCHDPEKCSAIGNSGSAGEVAENADIETIRELIPKARAIAAPVGPMHSLWDVIFDGEALLAGRQTFLSESPRCVAKIVRNHLERSTK